jgi:nicotinamidase-related amidase
MTLTTYYATHTLGHRDAEADAIVDMVNDLTAGSGDNRSWDATRARVDALADSATQRRLGIVVEAETHELDSEEE